MKSAFLAAAVAAVMLVASPPAFAGAGNSQQAKMTECNKKAEGKKGDERKAFMSDCLSSKGGSETTTKTVRECKTGKPCGDSCIAKDKVCTK